MVDGTTFNRQCTKPSARLLPLRGACLRPHNDHGETRLSLSPLASMLPFSVPSFALDLGKSKGE